jgi:hypothetical protein
MGTVDVHSEDGLLVLFDPTAGEDDVAAVGGEPRVEVLVYPVDGGLGEPLRVRSVELRGLEHGGGGGAVGSVEPADDGRVGDPAGGGVQVGALSRRHGSVQPRSSTCSFWPSESTRTTELTAPLKESRSRITCEPSGETWGS